MKSPPAGCEQASLDKRELVMRCKGRPIPDTTWGWVCDRCGLTLPQKPAPRPVPVPVAPGQTCLPGLAPEPAPPLAPVAPAPLPPMGSSP